MNKLLCCTLLISSATYAADLTYPVVDTAQTDCYDSQSKIRPAAEGDEFYGQDAQYNGNQPGYTDNGNGTTTDNITGLIWMKNPDRTLTTFKEAKENAAACRAGGYTDWRLPTVKELYSLVLFSGELGETADDSVPYLDTDYFDFFYGDEAGLDHLSDVAYWSSTEYTGKIMDSDPAAFGVNFADGHIKACPLSDSHGETKMAVRYVRGNPEYGKNRLANNGDGTITDKATGLMWQQADSGSGMDWEEALAYAGNLELAGHSDWRLPNAKELQSITDYSSIPAIDQHFFKMSDPEAWYWSSTTHNDGPTDRRGKSAAYIAFGKAAGWMQIPEGSEDYQLLDVHGAGAQRSDPKVGDAEDFPYGRGPQGNVIRINNYIRCVRDAK
ncbi:MAG: DUF1566 domain-containing protein [Kiritimatiellales bacterium]|jgi:hypothetical protein